MARDGSGLIDRHCVGEGSVVSCFSVLEIAFLLSQSETGFSWNRPTCSCGFLLCRNLFPLLTVLSLSSGLTLLGLTEGSLRLVHTWLWWPCHRYLPEKCQMSNTQQVSIALNPFKIITFRWLDEFLGTLLKTVFFWMKDLIPVLWGSLDVWLKRFIFSFSQAVYFCGQKILCKLFS